MQFKSFSFIPRLSRMAVYMEKIDGTNGVIAISEDREQLFAGSREKWLTRQDDNYEFSLWVEEHAKELIDYLGPGYHYGEWWGQGIGREYGLKERRFSLFNTGRWARSKEELESPPAWATSKWQLAPPCCHVVPVIDYKEFSTKVVDQCLFQLSCEGSHAAPGFMNPEGIVVAHIDRSKGATMFKKTFNGDKK